MAHRRGFEPPTPRFVVWRLAGTCTFGIVDQSFREVRYRWLRARDLDLQHDAQKGMISTESLSHNPLQTVFLNSGIVGS